MQRFDLKRSRVLLRISARPARVHSLRSESMLTTLIERRLSCRSELRLRASARTRPQARRRRGLRRLPARCRACDRTHGSLVPVFLFHVERESPVPRAGTPPMRHPCTPFLSFPFSTPSAHIVGRVRRHHRRPRAPRREPRPAVVPHLVFILCESERAGISEPLSLLVGRDCWLHPADTSYFLVR